MARQLLIDNDPALAVKRRNPWGVLGLTIVTLGIYGLVWWYKINKEMALVGRARQRPDLGDSPGTSLVALIAGAFVIVPAIVTFVTTSRRIQRTQDVLGAQKRLSGWLLAAISLLTLGIGTAAYQQYHLNRAWDALDTSHGAGGLPRVPAPASASAPPPPPPPSPFGDTV